MCLFNFLMIKILVDNKIKVEKKDEVVDVEIIEDDANTPEEVKSNINLQLTSDVPKPPLIPNTHSSNV